VAGTDPVPTQGAPHSPWQGRWDGRARL